MYVVTAAPVAILLCVVTMLGWGSWANTQKLAGREHWRFELYYWDYALGVLLCAVLFGLTLGSRGPVGPGLFENLSQGAGGSMGYALASGALFNLSNILLVVAIDRAGMAVAFPVGVGLALVIGTIGSYVDTPKGNALLLFAGVALILTAMAVSSLAHRRLPRSSQAGRHGTLFAVLAGCLMGFFYPQLARSISPEFVTQPIAPGMLTPYAALLLFGVGLVASNVVINTVFLRVGGLSYADYFRGSARVHATGLAGGAIWMIALELNIIASGVAGPAVSYALGQGAALVASLWGIFIWKEFRAAPAGTGKLLALMILGYLAGIVAIGAATL
ncbi:MAG: multidrug DMT transporter permease [Acidobacteria bacterium]|nr:multidrug DMT transporter permease [Acidobacteriota bacterium]